jgi:hypothetical protein
MSYCEGYFKLKAEYAAAEQADQLEARIAVIQSKLESFDAEAVAKATDPQAQFLASILHVRPDQVQEGLTILIALLVELGASLGFYTAFAYWRVFDVKGLPETVRAPAPVILAPLPKMTFAAKQQDEEPELLPAQPKTDVEVYFEERVGKEPGASVTALALYDDYCQWCEARGKQTLGLPIFTRKFSDLGVQKAKVAGRIRYMDIKLLFSEEDESQRELAAVS